MIWQTSRFRIALTRPQVMGIVNVTPDSFSDGGRYAQADAARAHCDRLVAQGADILDIGGESTRPGARLPDTAEQLARVVSVLRHAVTLGVPVSVDTADPVVMGEALALGVDILNDVRALQAPGALEVAAAHPDAGVCLMHMQGEPGSMQVAPHYDGDDVVAAVEAFLAGRRDAALAAGIARDRIVLDPGIGFGKTPEHNLALARQQRRLLALGCPLLLGWSRKSTLGQITGRPVGERTAASVAAALAAMQQGAAIVRVHDVAETVDALKTWRALNPT
ncbi:dihydropteroate synthase [Scleromatobacter humisilvae]|uniref:Dihydropteroate synthase n=1 Tax=Scleromatobacter humisilvae TaxID=2897159 RepID=A0A9X2C333_9BURK|nr:dihydropteroate synthase [Scleromatobacter humisilvae]MCK9686795.1 dihydropteroate synthase [Scleromatobacter humisilvae]